MKNLVIVHYKIQHNVFFINKRVGKRFSIEIEHQYKSQLGSWHRQYLTSKF